ncbi:MAG: hypothetical protein U0401_12890 [Anaerolineae bacterium]
MDVGLSLAALLTLLLWPQAVWAFTNYLTNAKANASPQRQSD